MHNDTIHNINKAFRRLRIDNAVIIIVGKEYQYEYLHNGFFKFGFKDHAMTVHKIKADEEPQALPENRITIFDYDKGRVITLPFPIDTPMTELELYGWAFETHGYDITKMHYLITTTDKNGMDK